MWIYFYISKERIAHIAHQVKPALLNERIKIWDIKGSLEGDVDAETSRLIQFLGAKGKVKAKGQTAGGHSTQTKFTPSDEAIVDSVRKHISQKIHFVDLASMNSVDQIESGARIVRFEGHFRPNIEIADPFEAIAEYERMEYIPWTGNCGNISITFITSKNSLVSHTPVVQCITNPEGRMMLQGFSTLLNDRRESPLPILPLFFGIEVTD